MVLVNHALLRQSVRAFRQAPKKSLTDTSKPLKYGAIFAGGCSLAGLGYTLTRSASPAQNAHIRDMGMWPSYVKDRVSGTFQYCLGGIGVTTAAAMATLRTPSLMRLMSSNSMFSFFGCIAAMMGTGMLCQSIPFDGNAFGGKALAYYLHMGVVGAVVAPIALVGGEACLMAAGLTAAVMAGLSLTAMVAPSDAYVKTYGVVNAGMFLMLGACAMSFFINPMTTAGMGIQSFIIFGGLGLFGVKGFSDINRCIDQAKRPGQFDPINNAIHISMDAINIFIRLAMILGGNRKK